MPFLIPSIVIVSHREDESMVASEVALIVVSLGKVVSKERIICTLLTLRVSSFTGQNSSSCQKDLSEKGRKIVIG
jgi:hypothetical protein